MYTLGIETSCDETSAAVFDGKNILSNVVASSLDLHSRFGGVVPEVASRYHVEAIISVIRDALSGAKIGLKKVGLIAVTIGPGLVGSLLVGISMAKALSSALGVKAIGVNHLKAHIYAGVVSSSEKVRFPCLGLVVSGGHTSLVLVKDAFNFKLLGQTMDDAAGEAFDKVAKILGLGYPGGPVIEKAALSGDEDAIKFPRAYMGDSLDFSFSGIKTAVLYYVKKHTRYEIERSEAEPPRRGRDRAERSGASPKGTRYDIAASFQKAVVDVLVDKTIKAAEAEKVSDIVIGGGVSANTLLRSRISSEGGRRGFKVHIPPKGLSVDNAAMTAALGERMYRRGYHERLKVDPVADLGFN